MQKLKADHKEFRQELRELLDIVRELKHKRTSNTGIARTRHTSGKNCCCALRIRCFASSAGYRVAAIRTVIFQNSDTDIEADSGWTFKDPNPPATPFFTPERVAQAQAECWKQPFLISLPNCPNVELNRFLPSPSPFHHMSTYNYQRQQFSNRSCMGCHTRSGADASYIWLDGVEQFVPITAHAAPALAE